MWGMGTLQWVEQLKKMKVVGIKKLIIQYGAYHDSINSITWYAPSSLPFVKSSYNTVNLIIHAAKINNIEVYIGLYFDPNWEDTTSKSSTEIYSELLLKQMGV